MKKFESVLCLPPAASGKVEAFDPDLFNALPEPKQA